MTLNPLHLKDLKASGISPAFARKEGLRSATTEKAQELMGRGDIGSGLVFPYPTSNRIKLDKPIPDSTGKPARYLTKRGGRNHLYMPALLTEALLQDTAIPLTITEGEKKALSASQRGIPCLATAGVWSWRGKGKKHIADLDLVEWDGRRVFIAYDTEDSTRVRVRNAARGSDAAAAALARTLTGWGAEVTVLSLPSGDGKKVGLDDYLKAHGMAGWELLVNPPPQPICNDHEEVMRMRVPPRRWIIPKLFCRPNLVNFHGAPFSGKTELLKALAVPLTIGGSFFGYDVAEPSGLFWANLDTEVDDTQEMYRRWPQGTRERVRVTHKHPSEVGGINEWLDGMQRSHDEFGWDVAVIDTMAQRLQQGAQRRSIDACNRGEVTEFLTPFRRIFAERKIMGIIVNHPRKPQMGDTAEMPSTGAFGSVAFGAMVDLSMRLRRFASGDAILDWQGRGRPDGAIHLHWDDGERRFSQTDAPAQGSRPARTTSKDERIKAALMLYPDGATASDLMERLPDGWDQRYVSKRLRELAKRGEIIALEERRGTAIVYRSSGECGTTRERGR